MNRFPVRLLPFLIALFFTLAAAAQQYGNEWINYEQTYYKISIKESGLYRISYTDLKNAGFPVDQTAPSTIRVFHHGREMAVYINGESDGVFDAGDYVEFYAVKNTGVRDSLVYRYASRPHPYQSLYSDETACFLTAGREKGRRITELNEQPGPVTDNFHLEEQVIPYTSQITFNNSTSLIPLVQQSYFEKGEGLSGKYMTADSSARFPLKMTGRVPGINPELEFQLNGRSRISHRVAYRINQEPPADTLLFSDYEPVTVRISLGEQQIAAEQVLLQTRLLSSGGVDWYSMSYTRLTYPQAFSMYGQREKYFNLPSGSPGKRVFVVPGADDTYRVYDITDFYTQKATRAVNGKIQVENAESILISNLFRKSPLIRQVRFRAPDRAADYLFITHASLKDATGEYAAYRRSAEGGGFKTEIVETQELYDQFNYGERNPGAIRQFASYMLAGGGEKYLLLVGRGVSFPDSLRRSEASDWVPTIGYPGSDALFTDGLAGYPAFVQAMPTGRLNVSTGQQIISYLEKVKEYEKNLPDAWNKQVLHLSGGRAPQEIQSLKSMLGSLAEIAGQAPMAGAVTARNKHSDIEVENIDISAEVNNGVALLTFAGHGSPTVIDLNFGYASDPKNNFKNKGRYPLMFFNGCGVGNIFYRYQTLTTDWLLTPDKGSIAILANSFWSYVSSTEEYLHQLYEVSFGGLSSYDLPIGKIQQEVHKALASRAISDPLVRVDLQQVVLQGDPAIRVFRLSKPDFSLDKIFIATQKTGNSIASGDSLKVGLIVSNYGRYDPDKSVDIAVKWKGSASGNNYRFTVRRTALSDTLMLTIPAMKDPAELSATIDPDNQIVEWNKDNNSAVLLLPDWDDISKNTVYPANVLPDILSPFLLVNFDGRPIRNLDFVSPDPIITVSIHDDNALPANQGALVEALLQDCENCPFKTLKEDHISSLSDGGATFRYALKDLQAGTYTFMARGKDLADNTTKLPFVVSFQVAENPLTFQWSVSPNPAGEFVRLTFTLSDRNLPETGHMYFYNQTGSLLEERDFRPVYGENILYKEGLAGLPAGMYHLVVQLNNQFIRCKIVKN